MALKSDLQRLKAAGFLIIIITNQSGIAKGDYQDDFVYQCFEVIQNETGYVIDDLYFASGHESVSKSLMRKPDSLLFEKAIAKHGIDVNNSVMIGDKERDLIPAKKLGMQTYLLSKRGESEYADSQVKLLSEAVELIIQGKG